jgi:hypothetical protein
MCIVQSVLKGTVQTTLSITKMQVKFVAITIHMIKIRSELRQIHWP